MVTPIMTEHEKKAEGIKVEMPTDIITEKADSNFATLLEGENDHTFMSRVVSIVKSGPPLSFSAHQLKKSRWIEDLIRKEVVRRSNDKSPSSATYKTLLADY